MRYVKWHYEHYVDSNHRFFQFYHLTTIEHDNVTGICQKNGYLTLAIQIIAKREHVFSFRNKLTKHAEVVVSKQTTVMNCLNSLVNDTKRMRSDGFDLSDFKKFYVITEFVQTSNDRSIL